MCISYRSVKYIVDSICALASSCLIFLSTIEKKNILFRSVRLGKNGVGEIKIHSFFTNHNEWTWETIRNGNKNQF